MADKKENPNKDKKLDGVQESLATPLNKNHVINYSRPIKDLSSEFADVYELQQASSLIESDKEYTKHAMIFDRGFPVRHEIVNLHKSPEAVESKLSIIYDAGVIKLEKEKTEKFCVIFGKPKAKSLRQLFADNPQTEGVISSIFLPQLYTATALFSDSEECHGSLNIDNIFYDPSSQKLYIGECLSGPCGYNQPEIFEPIVRMVCHRNGKGEKDLLDDYFAIGVIVIFLLTGKLPMHELKNAKAEENRLFKNSFITYTHHMKKVSSPMMDLLRGLLSDSNEKRWGKMQIEAWLRKKISQTASTPTKEAMRGVMFLDTEYFNCRSLVEAISNNFEKAKIGLRVNDLERWLRHGLLNNEMADQLEDVSGKSNENISLTDDEVYRVMAILDPYGPLRYGGVAINIYGLGQFLAAAFKDKKREMIQLVGDIFNTGLMYFWLKLLHLASTQDDPRYEKLAWDPKKIIKIVRNPALGFGMERILYDMNPTLPCLSPLLSNYYVTDLRDMLIALDEYIKDHAEDEIELIDRHLAAFIASRIDLRDEIVIKKIAEFEKISRNPNVIMMAFLVTAQVQARMKGLNNLSAWAGKKVRNVLGNLHGSSTKKDMEKALDRVSNEGDLNEILNLVTNPGYLKRDDFSFKEAKRYYIDLGNQINFLKRQENNERMAYEYGLRVSVVIAYLVLVGTIMYALTSF